MEFSEAPKKDQKSKNKELEKDVANLKKLFYETFEKSILLQQKVKQQLHTKNTQGKAVYEVILKSVNIEKFLFFNPCEFIEKCLNKEKVVNFEKLRKVRDFFTKIVMNIDRVIFQISNENETTLTDQLDTMMHIFDGLNKNTKQEKKTLRKLRKTLQCIPPQPASNILMIEGLSRARLLCMFYVKWLTIAENEYTDNTLAEADVEMKQEFSSRLVTNIEKISNTKREAPFEYLIHRLDLIEKKLDKHAKESKLDRITIKNELIIVKDTCKRIAEEYPNETTQFVENKLDDITALLKRIEKTIGQSNPDCVKQSKKWRKRLEQGIGLSADIIQIISFLTGLASLPGIINSETGTQMLELLKQLANHLKNQNTFRK